VTSVKGIIGLKYAKKYFLYRRERAGGIKAFFRHAIEYKREEHFRESFPKYSSLFYIILQTLQISALF